MKIVIAPDSFKESLSAKQAALAIHEGIRAVLPNADLQCIPMADGGEGTIDCLAQSVTDCQVIESQTVNALGEEIKAQWALIGQQSTAFIEMASAAGLQQIPSEQRDILQASTYGVGLLIKHALNYPITKLVLTLGGSATNDAGIGMLQALGVRFLDSQGQAISEVKPSLIEQIQGVDISNLDKRLLDLDILLAADVENPLYGPQGAAYIFAPQKGATPEQVLQLDQALHYFADKVKTLLAQDFAHAKGAGAAGGLGFAALSFLNAKFISGLKLIADYTQLESHIQEADLVITGEGSIDAQTLQGKTLAGIAQLCQAHKVPLIAFAGRLEKGHEALYEQGMTAAFSINPGGITQAQAMQDAYALLKQASRNVMSVYQLASEER